MEQEFFVIKLCNLSEKMVLTMHFYLYSGYMAPEYIVHGQLTERADIYSYGVLVLEIITGRKSLNSVASSAEGHSLMSLVILLHFHPIAKY